MQLYLPQIPLGFLSCLLIPHAAWQAKLDLNWTLQAPWGNRHGTHPGWKIILTPRIYSHMTYQLLNQYRRERYGSLGQGAVGTDLSCQLSIVFSRRYTQVSSDTSILRLCSLFIAKQTFWEEAFFFFICYLQCFNGRRKASLAPNKYSHWMSTSLCWKYCCYR